MSGVFGEQKNIQQLFEKNVSYLYKANERGECLYDKLIEIIQFLDERKPSGEKPLDLIDLLFRIEQEKLRVSRVEDETWKRFQADDRQVATARALRDLLKDRMQAKALEDDERAAKIKNLLQREQEAAGRDGDEEKMEEINKERKALFSSGISDVLDEANFFELGGIGLPKEELYAIAISMKQLAVSQNLKKVRFFGKLFGTRGNYIVVETEHVQQKSTVGLDLPLAEGQLPAEEPGVGTNKWSYWVCSKPCGSWTLLPDVKPNQITAARRIKKLLTGELDKPMRSYPGFPGNEANYLRAQIARIAAATAIAPRGFFQEKAPEEDAPALPIPELASSDEFEGVALKDPLNLEDFVHIYPHIREFGRCTKYKPPKKAKKQSDDGEEEEEEEEPEEEEAENPDVVALLRELSKDSQLVNPEGDPKKKKKIATDDGDGDAAAEEEEPEEAEEEPAGEEGKPEVIRPKPLQKKQPAWSARMFNTLNKNYAVALIKSHRWPGAYSFVTEKGRKHAFVYLGNGLKSQGGLGFTPMLPPMPIPDLKKLTEALDPSRINEKRILNNEEVVDENKEEGEPEEDEE